MTPPFRYRLSDREKDALLIAPVVTRIELFGGRCSCCGRRFRATAPAGMAPGSPFGARVCNDNFRDRSATIAVAG
ncbi:MAG TPA: hypothetical protein VLR47_02330 [Rhodospirillales bacterium]|nr:hypothetical protein [Rhodospirillales bacterium]